MPLSSYLGNFNPNLSNNEKSIWHDFFGLTWSSTLNFKQWIQK